MPTPDRERVEFLLAQLSDGADALDPARKEGARAAEKFERELGRLLAEYPWLERHADWVDFLRTHGGYSIIPGALTTNLDLFGLSHQYSFHLLDDPGDVVGEEDGCLCFGTVTWIVPSGGEVTVAFGFEATGRRPWGIYRMGPGEPTWFCETFLEWLERVASSRGGPLL